MIRHGSTFSGIGGFDLGFDLAGMETVWQIESDKWCRGVLNRQWPDANLYGDIEEVDVDALAGCQIISGGVPCFPKDTLILTETGLRPIQDVEVGDRVLTHKGRWCRVTDTHKKTSKLVEVSGMGHPGLKTTPDHKFLASERDRTYVHADEKWYSKITRPKWTPAEDLEGCFWTSPKKFPDTSAPPIRGEGNALDIGPFTTTMAWIAGYYLGDGWARITEDGRRGRVLLCLGNEQDEKAVVERCSVAGLPHHIMEQPTADRLIIHRRALARYLIHHFGTGAENKRIPAWVLGLSGEKRAALLRGYLAADGSERDNGDLRATTVSRKLAIGIRLLVQSLSYNVSVYHHTTKETAEIEGRTVNQRDQYALCLRTPKHGSSATQKNGRVYGLVRSVEQTDQKQEVYDLEVARDHSFIAEGQIVHNCQGFSVAGRGEGLDDDRSGLFTEFARVLRGVRPRWFVFENVPGLLSSNGGRDMGAVLGVLGDLGYTCVWRVLDSQHFGVPQRRRRLFIVGHLGEVCPPEVLLEPEGMCRDSPPSEEAGEEPAGPPPSGSWSESAAGGLAFQASDYSDYKYEQADQSRPITTSADRSRAAPIAVSRPDQNPIAFGTKRDASDAMWDLSPTLRSMNFDKSHINAGGQVGVVEIGEETNAETAKTHTREVLQQLRRAVGEEAFEQWRSGVADALQEAEVLQPAMHGGGIQGPQTDRGSKQSRESGEVPSKTEGKPDRMRGVRSNGESGRSPQRRRPDKQREVQPFSDLPELPHERAQQWSDVLFRRLRQHPQGSWILRKALSEMEEMGQSKGGENKSTHTAPIPRRLVPVECERLQGFPDNWTAYGNWHGLDVEVPHTAPKVSDTRRYRMLGNAVTMPVAAWIGRRIMALEQGADLLAHVREDA